MSTELQIIQTEALSASSGTSAQAEAQTLTAELQSFFDAAFQRNEEPHKEYARFALNVLQDPEKALASAQENWALQKEPSDTLLLARAAAASGEETVLREIAQWISTTGTQDVRLNAILPTDAAELSGGQTQ